MGGVKSKNEVEPKEEPISIHVGEYAAVVSKTSATIEGFNC